ncbi:MAG TPA: twin-arginine translocase TatA/TatE family subunit [Gemmatimonadales bacterium]|nr:twin-arginine translocase TatA/TatE family subunit [Gemmatimonadales bacterium]
MELSVWHIALLLLVFLLVFGAKRIPEIGSSLGQGIREFKRSIKEIGDNPPDQRTNVPPPSATNSTLPPTGGEPKRLSQ